MIHRFSYSALLVLVALSMMFLLMMRSGWGGYLWWRFSGGSEVYIADRCLMIPPNWTVAQEKSEDTVYLRGHFIEGSGVLASIVDSSSLRGMNSMALAPAGSVGGFDVYDVFGGDAVEGVRYVAISGSARFGLMSSRHDLILELAADLLPCK